MMKKKYEIGEQRTEKQIKEHYEIEKQLAKKLHNASSEKRRFLYASIYEEMYRRIPHHPQFTRKVSPEQQKIAVDQQIKIIRSYLNESTSFLEIGPGDCSLSFEVAKLVKKVYAIDVSETITDSIAVPDNFQLILSDGISIPVPKCSIDVAFSNHLMEHLHPDDAVEHVKNVFDALALGGCYICITPSRLNGPHDISKYFDTKATGLHLKEYTVSELSGIFKSVGFSKMYCYLGGRGIYIKASPVVSILLECILELLPIRIRRRVSNFAPIRALINVRVIGIK